MSFAYSLFDTLLEPVFVLNAEQKVVYCNETAAIVCDMTVRKITRGLVFESLLQFNEPLEALKNLPAVTEALPYRELNFTNMSGQEGKVQITLQPIPGPAGENHWIVFVRDVTLEERLQKKYRAELEQKEDVIKALEDAKAKLEDYSKNLEHMVAERTKELAGLNQKMSALLDSLGQGFFIFNQEGLCLEVNSKACEDTVECLPAGQKVWDVLKLAPGKVEGFQKWMTTLFMEMLPFEDLAPLGPNVFPHSQGRHISLEYFPLRNADSQMDGVVVVASDITSLVEAQKQAEREKENAKLIINLVKSKKEIARFIRDSESLLHDLNMELAAPTQDYEAVYRYLHTLKGGAASFSIQSMAEVCHEAENQVNLVKEHNFAPADFAKLREICGEIGESFHRFLEEAREILGATNLSTDRQIEIPYSKLDGLLEKIASIPRGDSIVSLLTRELMMEPVSSFFEPYKELSQRVAEKEGKSLHPLIFHHEDIPVLPEVYSNLFATFVHAFRNAVDHGIEFPSVREEQGKDPAGRIEVFFELSARNELQIRVKDDGAGVDPAKIRARLSGKGISTDHESDQQVIQHIFDSQFSTREVVTETSGRGVGMDAIQSAALALGGRAWVESAPGKGTELFVLVPYLTHSPRKLSVAA